MMHRRLEIDQRHRRMFCKCSEDWISPLFFPILQRRKRAHTDRAAVARQHPHKLRDVFGLVSIHHDAVAMFERPTSAAGFEHNCMTAEFVNTNLHRGARAQTWIEEDEGDGLAAELVR